MILEKRIIAVVCYIIISFLFLSSCAKKTIEYSILENEINGAWKNSNRDEMLSIAGKITEEYFTGEDGLKYLKLKLLALTFAGEYKSAFLEIEVHSELFTNNIYDYEFFAAQGLISWKINMDAIYYFTKAFEALNRRESNKKTNGEKLLECYLATVLDKKNFIDFHDSYNSLTGEEKLIADYYFQLNKEDLLRFSPINFISMDPIYDVFSEDKENWWTE
jgi:hypothetical protein